MNPKSYNISLTDGDTKILLAIIAKRAETESPCNIRYLQELQTNIFTQIEAQGFEEKNLLLKSNSNICNEWLASQSYKDYYTYSEVLGAVVTTMLYFKSDTNKKHPLCDLGTANCIETMKQFLYNDMIRIERAKNMASLIGSPVPDWAIDEESLIRANCD